MWDISSNNIITMVRGDTFSTSIFVNEGTALLPVRYTLQENDNLYFAVMEANQSFENALIKKVMSKDDLDVDGDVKVSFKSTDTEYIYPGVYYYTIKLYKAPREGKEEEILTIIPKTKFVILD